MLLSQKPLLRYLRDYTRVYDPGDKIEINGHLYRDICYAKYYGWGGGMIEMHNMYPWVYRISSLAQYAALSKPEFSIHKPDI